MTSPSLTKKSVLVVKRSLPEKMLVNANKTAVLTPATTKEATSSKPRRLKNFVLATASVTQSAD